MEAYRDQYATLFNNGRGAVATGVSLDPDSTLINWFRELETPIMVIGDTDKKVSQMYQALNAAGTADSRHLYVIDKTGKVTYKALPFRVMAQDAYTELEAEIDKLNPPKSHGVTHRFSRSPRQAPGRFLFSHGRSARVPDPPVPCRCRRGGPGTCDSSGSD